MSTYHWVIQYVESAATKVEAESYLDFLRTQDGFISGRVIGNGTTKPFAAQAFFDDSDEQRDAAEWLPDGCRRVLAPGWLLRRDIGVTS